MKFILYFFLISLYEKETFPYKWTKSEDSYKNTIYGDIKYVKKCKNKRKKKNERVALQSLPSFFVVQGFYCSDSVHLTNITSTPFIATWEEIAIMAGIFLLIIVLVSFFVCWRRRCCSPASRRGRHGRRGGGGAGSENGGVVAGGMNGDDRNMIPLLAKANGGDVEIIRTATPKMSNVDQTQTQVSFLILFFFIYLFSFLLLWVDYWVWKK